MEHKTIARLKQTEICRFCLRIEQESNLTPVLSGFFSEMLKELDLKMNLLVTRNPVICYNCLEKLQKSVFFKEMCNLANERKFNAKDLCDSSIEHCTLCPDIRTDCIKSETIENSLSQQTLLQRHVPLITYGHSKINICQACDQHLKAMDEFLKICLNTEAKISIFIKLTKSEGTVSLHSVNDYNWTKEEGNPNVPHIKEEIDIEINEVKPNISQTLDKEDQRPTKAKKNKRRSTPLKKEKTKTRSKINKIRAYKTSSSNEMYCCNNCKFQSKFKASLVRHLIIHKSNNEVETFQCNECNFVTKYKASLVIHFLVHKTPSEIPMFKCDVCPFQSKLKKNLMNHKITHKKFTEDELMKCPSCSFTTKFKSNLTKHSIIHKSKSEVTMYKCTHCPYETRFKRNLKKHNLVHKNPSEVKTYNCDQCDFVSKFKYSLIKHALVHKDVSEVKMYKCTLCSFQTKFKYGLVRHGLTHKSISEVSPLYECEHCSYKSKLKSNLIQHCSRHRLATNSSKKPLAKRSSASLNKEESQM